MPEKICQYCGKAYYIKQYYADISKFCSRSCHDKGKVYKKVGTKPREARELRIKKRMSVSEISKALNIPYRSTASYVKQFPLSKDERDTKRLKKQEERLSKLIPKSTRAIMKRYRISHCEYPKCRWKVTLETHHVDGNHDNWNRSNIQILCPNHHSITPNYRNRKRPLAGVVKR